MNARPLGLAALLTAAACSGSGVYRAPVASGYVGPRSVAAHAAPVAVTSAQPSAGYDVAPSALAPAASESSAGRAANIDPAARPGLATTWGERVSSRVRYTDFERASATPFDTATIWYNDARLAGMQAERAAERAEWVAFGPRHDGVRVSLRDERGMALPGVVVGGRVFVLGESGQRYSVLLENRTAARFEALVTVDGLDVINGSPGSFANRGYILQPFGRVEIHGFRQSLNQVAAFRFGAVGDSYAAQRGDARNVGVIGVALFAERGYVFDVDENEVELRDSANPFPGGFAPPPPRRVW